MNFTDLYSRYLYDFSYRQFVLEKDDDDDDEDMDEVDREEEEEDDEVLLI